MDFEASLSKIVQRKQELSERRPYYLNKLALIDQRLTEIDCEYGVIVNTKNPLMKLPMEVTCMIFDFYLAGYSLPDFREMFPRSPLLPEVTLSHVCQQWRKISLNYAKLWTRFCCIMELVKSIPDQITRFDTYIQRSGCQKLEIFLQFKDYGYNEDQPPSLTQLLSLALKQVERWKGVTLIGLPKNHSNILDWMESAKAPNLEYFVFSPGYSLSSSLSPRTRPTMFKRGDAPKLRYLLLDDLCNVWPPLNNITTLHIEKPHEVYDEYDRNEIHNDAILRDILSIPSLVNLSLVGSPSIPPTLKFSETIDMKSLKHLRYIFHPYMTHLLPFIRAPLLETLMIQHDDWRKHIVDAAHSTILPNHIPSPHWKP